MSAKHSFAEAFAKSTSRLSEPHGHATATPPPRGRTIGAASAYANASGKTTAQTRRHKLLRYLPMTMITVFVLAGAFVLGGFVFPRATPNPANAGETAQKKTNDDGKSSAERFLTTPTGDVPMMEYLLERQALLDNREKQLNKREEGLRDLEQELEKKLASLTLLRKEIGSLVEEKEVFEAKRFEHLVKVYEGMKPAEAAPLVERLNTNTAVRLFYRMEEKKVSRILGFLNPEIAAKLSEHLAMLQQNGKYNTARKE